MLPGGVVFAADGSTVLRSADSGRTWAAVASEDVNFTPLTVLAAAADPGHVVYASRRAIYVSADGGLNFKLAARPPSEGPNQEDVGPVAPSVPGTFYAMLAGDSRVFRSDDRAATWRLAGTLPIGFPGGSEVLLADPRNPARVYVGTSYGLFKSADGGRTWKRSEAGLPRPLGESLPILSLAAAPSQPDALYAGPFDWGVARSRSAGERCRSALKRWPERPAHGPAGEVPAAGTPPSSPSATRGHARSAARTAAVSWQQFARGLSRGTA